MATQYLVSIALVQGSRKLLISLASPFKQGPVTLRTSSGDKICQSDSRFALICSQKGRKGLMKAALAF